MLPAAILKIQSNIKNKALSSHADENTGPICVNQETLRYAPEAYQDLDIVVYDDNKGRTWCFTSEDFVPLLEKKYNPVTAEPLTKSVIDEIQSKLDVLKSEGVKIQPTDIGTGVRKLRAGGYEADTKSSARVQELKDYYTLYGIDPDLLTQSYTIEDMQNILDQIYDPSPQLDPTSRTHSLNSFAHAITRDVSSAPDPNQRLGEIFEIIIAYGEPIPE